MYNTIQTQGRLLVFLKHLFSHEGWWMFFCSQELQGSKVGSRLRLCFCHHFLKEYVFTMVLSDLWHIRQNSLRCFSVLDSNSIFVWIWFWQLFVGFIYMTGVLGISLSLFSLDVFCPALLVVALFIIKYDEIVFLLKRKSAKLSCQNLVNNAEWSSF